MRPTDLALILPVENQVRELDAKLLLACVAAERGFSVILGSRAYVHYQIHRLPRGIYLAKSMRSRSERLFSILDDLGHEIVGWDEEGLVRFPSADYYRRRLSEKAFRRLAMIFAWGPDDAEAFERFPGYHGAPIHVTGNPRVDLMREELHAYWEEPVAEIRRRYRSFVLVNTNFGFVNNFVSTLNLIQVDGDGGRRLGENTTGMTREFAEGMAAHKQALFDHFRAALPCLRAALPSHAIVVRPHPSENPGPWITAARGLESVHVNHQGNVLPWLLAAELLIHNGCTTAVEAAVLGTPAIAYQPVRSPGFDFALPNSLSHRALDALELVDGVGRVLRGALGRLDDETRRAILARHLASLDGPLASERIVDALADADLPRTTPPMSVRARAWARNRTRTVQKLVRSRRRDHRNSRALHEHRFPELTASELRERVDRYARCLGRFRTIAIEKLSEHLFRLERAG